MVRGMRGIILQIPKFQMTILISRDLIINNTKTHNNKINFSKYLFSCSKFSSDSQPLSYFISPLKIVIIFRKFYFPFTVLLFVTHFSFVKVPLESLSLLFALNFLLDGLDSLVIFI